MFSLTPASPFVDDLSVLPAATANVWRTAMASAVDGVGGGAYTPTAKIQIGGLGVELTETTGAAARVQLASRSVTRHLSMAGVRDANNGVGSWSYRTGSPQGTWKQDNVDADLFLPLEELPHGDTLTAVAVGLDGAGGHGGNPTFPTLHVYYVDSTGTANAIGVAQADSVLATYETAHYLTKSGMAHVIDRTAYRYYAYLTGEGGANFVAALACFQLKATCTVTGNSGWW